MPHMRSLKVGPLRAERLLVQPDEYPVSQSPMN